MSSRGGSSSSNGGGGGALQSVPSSCRNIVQSLKEIVNGCSELEIYAALKECNMDPNEAVNRLLTQDPFHEVKSKREKKKEKDTSETRSRGSINTSNRGGRNGTDRYVGRGGTTQFSSTESGASHGKSYKKENGTNYYVPSSVAGNHTKQQLPSYNEYVPTVNEVTRVGASDGNFSSSQPSLYQPAWSGVPGQVSMADIVKMGRQGNPSTTVNPSQYGASHRQVQASRPDVSHHEFYSSEDYATKVSESQPEQGIGAGQHVSQDDDWPLDPEPQPESVPSMLEPHADEYQLPSESINQYPQSWNDERVSEDEGIDRTNEAPAGGKSLFNSEVYENMVSHESHSDAFARQEAEETGLSVSSLTTNLQQLNIQENQGVSTEEDSPSVVIPEHLLAQSADCPHLSFGSFGSGLGASLSRPLSSTPLNNTEDTSADANSFSVGNLDARNSEYYGEETLGTISDANLVHGTGTSTGNYESASTPQPEVLKEENMDAPHGNQYTFSPSSNYNFENEQQLRDAFPHSQAYSNSLSSSLLTASGHPVRESDIQYSPFPVAQSIQGKYGNDASAISGSSISVSEALKTTGFSSGQPTAQTLSGNNIGSGAGLPQHVSVNPYSQAALPLGPFSNMFGYPFLPQSYTYVPPTFQQAFAGNNSYQQSLAALLPQYKNSLSASSVPQSATNASGYGSLGSSAPGNFPGNSPAAAPAPTNLGYDDMSSQFKDNSHLTSHHQSENSGNWAHGSRTMSAVPANAYYSYPGQSEQQPPSGYRQSQQQQQQHQQLQQLQQQLQQQQLQQLQQQQLQQQLQQQQLQQQMQQSSQNYGANLGYQNLYHSQSGTSLDHHHLQQQHQQQQQNHREAALGGSQGQPSKQSSQQLWQNSY